MRYKPEVVLLVGEDQVLDFVNENIREEHIKKEIFLRLDKDANEDLVTAIKIPYLEKPCVVVMKWGINNKGGILFIGADDWQTIFRMMDGMRDSLSEKEKEFFIKHFTDLVRQVNQIEKR